MHHRCLVIPSICMACSLLFIFLCSPFHCRVLLNIVCLTPTGVRLPQPSPISPAIASPARAQAQKTIPLFGLHLRLLERLLSGPGPEGPLTWFVHPRVHTPVQKNVHVRAVSAASQESDRCTDTVIVSPPPPPQHRLQTYTGPRKSRERVAAPPRSNASSLTVPRPKADVTLCVRSSRHFSARSVAARVLVTFWFFYADKIMTCLLKKCCPGKDVLSTF
jgi:hypothetical protein